MNAVFSNDPLERRLLPFYSSVFFNGFIMWFAIEKVFMKSIGFDASSIATALVLMNIVVLLTEIPAGVLADRWSRKGVLFVSLGSLLAATLVMGIAQSKLEYMAGLAIFGLYYATNSGLNESIVYDTLLEVRGSRQGFEKYYGRERTVASIALVISSVLGGIIAQRYGLKYTYLLTIPFTAASMIALLGLQEPVQHQRSENSVLLRHIKETFSFVFKKGDLLWIVTALLSLSIISMFLLEMDQLWPLALAMPIVVYGPLNALLLFGYGLGGPLAHWFGRLQRTQLIVGAIAVALVAALSIRNMPIIAFAQFGVISMFSALFIIANGKLHDRLPSKIRAGSASVISSTTTVLFLPLALLFGRIAQHVSIFSTTYLLLPIALCGVVCYVVVMSHHTNKTI